ncbi:hypothetical protein [Actinoplanes regularis]|uniref:hypothetical protein n=1 Tax=Actinoplanes regularis TaxID=52697 RepID=UPI0024A0756F|nr:hypothetical protein [Actinoplanes regularis]GLW35968.1 hypothetical protein Areg01_89030 [Actinoplanes regularis]
MQRRTVTLVRAMIIPAVIAAGGLALATAAQAGPARSADHAVAARMPLIGSGTHPVEATDASWGVGNG